jgi:N utilization substance protein A
VGARGIRVQAVVDELSGEKIDIISWSNDAQQNISNALSPAKVERVIINDDGKSATVVVPDYQLSLAIGKEGQNVRLAAKLCGWKIDIKSHSQYFPDYTAYENGEYDEAGESADANAGDFDAEGIEAGAEDLAPAEEPVSDEVGEAAPDGYGETASDAEADAQTDGGDAPAASE